MQRTGNYLMQLIELIISFNTVICLNQLIYCVYACMQSSAVQVKNVLYKNIEGTSASEVAVKFDCSKSYPCEGIVLQDVNLRREVEDEAAKAECNNVDDLAQTGVVSPRCP